MASVPLLRRSDGGHAMAQLAACRRALGVATVDRLTLLELRGSSADLAAAYWTLGGSGAWPGAPERLACGWWHADTPYRSLVLEDPATPGRLGRRRNSLARWHPDVTITDVSDMHLGLILAGPLAPAAAARYTSPAMTASDGEQYTVLVLRRQSAADVREVALDAGRRDGGVLIASQTAELHRAARRTGETVASACVLQTFIDTTTTGVPYS